MPLPGPQKPQGRTAKVDSTITWASAAMEGEVTGWGRKESWQWLELGASPGNPWWGLPVTGLRSRNNCTEQQHSCCNTRYEWILVSASMFRGTCNTAGGPCICSAQPNNNGFDVRLLGRQGGLGTGQDTGYQTLLHTGVDQWNERQSNAPQMTLSQKDPGLSCEGWM